LTLGAGNQLLQDRVRHARGVFTRFRHESEGIGALALQRGEHALGAERCDLRSGWLLDLGGQGPTEPLPTFTQEATGDPKAAKSVGYLQADRSVDRISKAIRHRVAEIW